MKDKNKKRLLLCFCCAMAISALPLGFASCDKNKKPTSSVEKEYGEEGVYYCNVDGKDCSLILDNKADSFTMIIGNEIVVGTYSYNGKDFKMKVKGAKESITAVYENGALTFVYNEVTYTFLTKVDYTVTFDVDGEKTTQSVLNGQFVNAPADPEKEGYNFIGWYLDAEYKTLYSFESMPISKDITLHARFAEKIAGANEYVVTYVVDGKETGTAETISGAIFELPVPEKEGAEFIGWWTSATDDAEKLTAQYKAGQVLSENTKLFAVWKSADLNVSVTANKITWREANATASYDVKIYDADGATVHSGKANAEEYEFDFSKQPAGTYKIEVSVVGASTVSYAYYHGRELDKVSTFNVANGVLTFAGVPNAQKYFITVECGNTAHMHDTKVDLGTKTSYNFADCKMQKGGIKFTVEAVADGYMTSVSDTYVYEKNLAEVTGLAVNKTAEQIGWNAVENATAYVVEVTVGGKTYTHTVVGTTVFSLRDYTGDLSVKVYATANGYNSPDGQVVEYSKTTLVAPAGLTLQEKTLKWNAVDGATKYVVKIGDKEFEVATNQLVLTDEHCDETQDKYQVYVKAIGADTANSSAYSDALLVRFASMSPLSYVNGVLSWESVISAKYYYVKVNAQPIQKIPASQTTYEPVLDLYGANNVTVYYENEDAETSEMVTTVINAYKIDFYTEGGSRVAPLYKATGDKLTLPTDVTKDGYDFAGWYTAVGGATGTGTKYTENIYQDAGNRTLYAAWTPKTYTATLDVMGGDEFDDNQVKVTFKSGYKLPIPTHSDSSYVFAGWYNSEEGAIGSVQYTDNQGNSLTDWNSIQNETLAAKWLHVFAFTEVAGGTYSVRAGVDIRHVTTIYVPAMYNGKKVSTIDQGAFAGYSNLIEINIPDTISTVAIPVDGGHGAGSAFQNCSALKAVNVYCHDESDHHRHEQKYFSSNGVLIYENAGVGREIKYVPATLSGKFVVPTGVTVLPVNAFKGSKVTEVVIPNTVTKIQDAAFDGCGITSITFEEGGSLPLELGAMVFRKCRSLKEITLPSRLSNFDSSWFTSCDNLTQVNISGEGGKYNSQGGAGVLCEGSKLIYVPVGLRATDYTIPAGITEIGENAFVNARYFQANVVIPHYVTEIGEGAFRKSYIKSVVFEGDETSELLNIRSYAFYECANLRALTLPVNIGIVEECAFGKTTNITKVTVLGGENMDLQDGAFKDDSDRYSIQEVYLGANVGVFNVAGVFGGEVLHAVNVDPANQSYESGTEGAGDAGVLYNKGKKSLVYYPTTRIGDFTIPDSVETIGAEVFRAKLQLTKIVIGPNVKYIGTSAFRGCSNLTEIKFTAPTGTPVALEIADYAFANTSITDLAIPDRATKLGDSFVYGCGKLLTISIGSGVSEIGYYEDGELVSMDFGYCNVLQNIVVSEANKAFASIDGILYGKTAVTTGTGDSATTNYVITDLFFAPRKNSGVEGAVVIPNTVKKVWDAAFNSTTNITSIAFDGALADQEAGITFGVDVFKSCAASSISLPVGVKEIPSNMFSSCQYLTKVTVPYTVTKIHPRAFSYCTKLSTIEFQETPDEVDEVSLVFEDGATDSYYVGIGAIYACNSLQSIALPDRTTKIGKYAFTNNNGLKSVSIPESVSSIGTGAFIRCPALETVAFAENGQLVSLDDGMFEDCVSLKSVTLPNGMVSIGEKAFFNCEGLETINIPNTLKTIGASAFENARALKTVLIDTENSVLESIGERAFYYCISLEKSKATLAENETPVIALPNTLKTIAPFAFTRSSALKGVTIEDGSVLASIGEQAFAYTDLRGFAFPNTVEDETGNLIVTQYGAKIFAGCRNMTSLKISNAITAVDGLLKGCYSVTSVTIDEANAKYMTYVDPNMSGVVFLMNKAGTEYYGSFGTVTGKLTIKEGVVSIGDSVFANCTKITEVAIPASVQVIANNAFKACTALTKVTIADGSQLTKIGASAFEGCTKLGDAEGGINLENAVVLTTIGSKAFYKCSKLTSVELPDSVMDTVVGETVTSGIGTSAFESSGLTSISIPSGVRTIGSNAFKSAPLTDVTLHQYVSEIGASAFYGTKLPDAEVQAILDLLPTIKYGANVFQAVKTLTKLTIPATMTVVPAGLANGCTALAEVTFHDNIVTIGNDAFRGCTALSNKVVDETKQTFKMPANLQTIGNYAFYNCNLTDVTLNNTLKTIGSFAFYGGKFASIDLPNSLTNVIDGDTMTVAIGASAFENCKALTSVVLPAGVKTLGNKVFAGCAELTSVEFPENFEGFNTSAPSSYSSIKNYGTFYGCNKLTVIELPATVTSVGCAFAQTKITEIYFSAANMVSIPKFAFYGCTALKVVDIDTASGSQISSIANYAFQGTTSLTSFDLPSSVITISDYAFQNSGITSIDTSKVVSIGTKALQNTAITAIDFTSVTTFASWSPIINCTKLTSVTFNKDTQKIPGDMFDGCTSLAEVTLPDALTSFTGNISGYLIRNTAIKELVFPVNFNPSLQSSVKFQNAAKLEKIVINSAASWTIPVFTGCTSLKTIEFGKDCVVVKMNAGAFKGLPIENITLPDTLTSIPNQLFQDCKSLKSVTLPKGATTMGTDVFKNCSALETVVMPETLTALPNNTFVNCTSLTNITWPKALKTIGTGVFTGCKFDKIALPNTVESIGTNAFANMTTLTEVTLPTALTKIDASAFQNTGLTSVTLPATMKTLGNNAFAGCASLADVKLNEGLQTIGNYAFSADKLITSITIPSTVTSLGTFAFNGCTGIASIAIPGSVKTIGSNAFVGCTNLATVTLGNGVESIGSYAFQNLSKITQINFPETLKTIGDYAFANTGLSVISIPAKVSTIGVAAFGTESLKEFFVSGDNETFSADENGILYRGTAVVAFPAKGIVDENGVLTIPSTLPEGTSFLGGSLYIGGVKKVVFPDGLAMTSIPNSMFSGWNTLQEIAIPEGVTSIGSSAFSGCTQLTTLTLPSTLKTIGSSAFNNCMSLTDIELPDGVTTINSSAFNGCSNLSTISLSSSLQTIGSNAFKGCKFTEIDLPASVQRIDSSAFENMTTLTRVNVPETSVWNYIGSKAFYGCTNLEYIYFPETITYVGTQSFQNLKKLNVDVNLTENVTTFNANAFNGSGIKSIVLPKTEKIIGYEEEREGTVLYYSGGYFSNMPNLEKITFLGTEIIGGQAFTNLPKLHTVEYSDDLYAIGNSAFSGSGLTHFEVKPTLTDWGYGVFSNCNDLEVIEFLDGCTRFELFIGNEWEQFEDGYMITGGYYGGTVDSLTTVIFPDTMEYIYQYAFAGCTNLQDVVLPKNVTVGYGAFEDVGQDCTIYTPVSQMETQDLWSSGWTSGYGGTIVYNYDPNATEEE